MNGTKLKASSLPLAPSAEQHRIVAALDSYFSRLDDAVATLKRVQANLKRYRASVLQAAVEGRLVPTEAEQAKVENRDYEPASVLLERILIERRRRWEEAELAKMKAKGKEPKNDKWKAKYKEPAAPDTDGLPELPEGWCWVHLGEVATFINGDRGKNYPNKSEYVPSGLPFINTGHIRPDGGLSTESMHYITREKFQSLRGGKIERGDLVYCLRGATLGKTAIVDFDEGAIASSLVIVRPEEPRFARYLYHFLVGPLGRTEIEVHDNGTAQPNLAAKSVSRYLVPIPPLQEQCRIVEELDRLLSTAAVLTDTCLQSVRRGRCVRQSILKWAFEGKLVDQDPTDEPASALLERIQQEREASDSKSKSKSKTTRKRKAKA